MSLHGRLQKSKIRRREGLKGLQSYIRPVGAGCSSCWPWWHSRVRLLSAHRAWCPVSLSDCPHPGL